MVNFIDVGNIRPLIALSEFFYQLLGFFNFGYLFFFHIYGGGVDVRKLEPNLNTIKPLIRDLRKLYKQNPNWFEVPKFAIKVY